MASDLSMMDIDLYYCFDFAFSKIILISSSSIYWNGPLLYTFFIPYTYCTDLSNLIYLPILVNIINVITLCLIKEPFKECYLYT